MIVIAGEVRIDPTNQSEAITAAVKMMEESQREEGCISYVISRDLIEEGGFRIFEEWESQEALDFHFATPHMADFQKAMGSLGVLEMAVKRYEVSSVAPLGG